MLQDQVARQSQKLRDHQEQERRSVRGSWSFHVLLSPDNEALPQHSHLLSKFSRWKAFSCFFFLRWILQVQREKSPVKKMFVFVWLERKKVNSAQWRGKLQSAGPLLVVWQKTLIFLWVPSGMIFAFIKHYILNKRSVCVYHHDTKS